MAIASFTYDMNIISALADEPNDVGGLTAGELKAKFDEGGNAVKAYLNETLLPGITEEIKEALLDAVIGEVPGITVVIPLGETIPPDQRKQGAVYWNVVAEVTE